MKEAFEVDGMPAQKPLQRKSARIGLNAEVMLRRSGQINYRANVFDLSQHGCKVEFVERPALNEIVWVRFPGLEALEARVCWIEGHSAGLEFQSPVHYAVFGVLVARLRHSQHP